MTTLLSCPHPLPPTASSAPLGSARFGSAGGAPRAAHDRHEPVAFGDDHHARMESLCVGESR